MAEGAPTDGDNVSDNDGNVFPPVLCFHGLATVAIETPEPLNPGGSWIHHEAPGCVSCTAAGWRSASYRPRGAPSAAPSRVVAPSWAAPPAPPIDYAKLPEHLRPDAMGGPPEARQATPAMPPGLEDMKPLPCGRGACAGLLRYAEQMSLKGKLYTWTCDFCGREAVRGPAVGFVGQGGNP